MTCFENNRLPCLAIVLLLLFGGGIFYIDHLMGSVGMMVAGWIVVIGTILAVVSIREAFTKCDRRLGSQRQDIELSDFVAESLWGVAKGIDAANRRFPTAKLGEPLASAETLFFTRYSKDARAGSGIEFDIAVTSVANHEQSNIAKFKVAVVEGNLGMSTRLSRTVLSRMKFTVYVKHWSGIIEPNSVE